MARSGYTWARLAKIARLAVFLWLFAAPSWGAVVRFEIVTREPFAAGKEFGEVGPYERISGKVHFAIDPRLKQNQGIVDLNLAPKNAAGLVEFSSDLCILTPREPAKGNGALLYDVNNRGNKLALGFFNFAGGGNAANEPGDGFLMRHGFTVVWSGWDGELLPGGERLQLFPPVATAAGQPITGLIRCEMVPNSDTTRMIVTSWENHGSYRPTSEGLKNALLTWRRRPELPRIPIPRDQWNLKISEPSADSPRQLPRIDLEMPGGMERGAIYELIYEAQHPLVHGVCFAGVRDLVAALKQGDGVNNPCVQNGTSPLRRAHGFGVSQSGRFLREFLYSGFNTDEHGRKVFEGLIPHVSGSGMGSFNHRFAQPTRHCNQHDHHDYPGDRFPFSYVVQTDPLSGKTDGLLRRADADGTAPFILHTQSAGEYWTRSGSLSHTDPLGERDVVLPPNVRVYLFGGTQHGPAGFPPSLGSGQNLPNPGDYKPFLRALLLALEGWSRDGTPAPPSVYPTLAQGTLVGWDQAATGFPQLPGVRYPRVIQQPPLLDFGPRWETAGIADIQPPRILGSYRVLVPKCGPDGNEVDCLSPPEVAVPLATFTGWNLRRKEAGAEDELVALMGSYLPLPNSKAEREMLKDPRESLEERYGTLAAYLEQLAKKCRELQAAGYLESEDGARILRQQAERARPLFDRIKPSSP